jgi:uncharacterized protein (UPF0371 family)
MPKKGEKKELKEVKQDKEPKRADFKLRNYTEDNLIEDITKLKKQIEKLELSINAHDAELEKKRTDHKEFQKQLKEMETIKELLAKVEI